MWQGVGVKFFARRNFLFLFPKQYIMSPGDPIFSLTLHKNTPKVSTKPTLLIWFTHVKRRAPAMQYSLVLPAAPLLRSPLVNPLSLSLYVHLFTAGSLEPIPQDLEGSDISCRAALHLPPHTQRSPKGSPQWASFPTLRPSTQTLCQRCGEGKYSPLLWNLFLRRAASLGRGAKETLYFGRPNTSALS